MKRIFATIIMLCVLCSVLTSCHDSPFTVNGLTDEYGNTYDVVAYRNEMGVDCYIGHIYCYVSSDINNFKIVIPKSLRDDTNGKDYPVVKLRGPSRTNGPIEGISISIELQNEQIINAPIVIEIITHEGIDDIYASTASTYRISDINDEIIHDVDVLFVKAGTNHEHTYEIRSDALCHYRSYTCGCKDAPSYRSHYGFEEDDMCDECGYEHHHTKEEYRREEGHGWNYTCGCETPDNFAQHSDANGDGACDECGYTRAGQTCSF